MLRKVKRIWFVVADSARAHFFTLNGDGTGLVDVDGVELSAPEVRVPARDLKSDRPGRSFGSSGGGVRHAIEPHHDFHKLEKHKFIVHLAETLEKAWAAKKFDALVLVAPRRSLGELRISLPDHVQASVEHELAKDLTKHPTASLWSHLAPIADRLLRTA